MFHGDDTKVVIFAALMRGRWREEKWPSLGREKAPDSGSLLTVRSRLHRKNLLLAGPVGLSEHAFVRQESSIYEKKRGDDPHFFLPAQKGKRRVAFSGRSGVAKERSPPYVPTRPRRSSLTTLHLCRKGSSRTSLLSRD